MPTEFLFSYGTLQLEAEQLATFGRRLDGKPDVLPGFEQAVIEIADEATVSLSGKKQHSIARFTGRPSDSISGTVFELTPEEIKNADDYEAPEYQRVSAVLKSGTRAWVYVDRRFMPPA